MANAVGGRVPRVDPEDQGCIPEHLLNLSFRMAMFLRYDAVKKRITLDDGWLDVRILLAQLSESHPEEIWEDKDVLQVVETSFSKDKPRFETKQGSDGYQVRAAPKVGGHKSSGRSREHRAGPRGDDQNWSRGGQQDQGWQQSWASSGQRPHVKRQHGWERGADSNARGNSDSGWSSDFDGDWQRQSSGEEAAPLCDIRRTMLKWKDHPTLMKIRVRGNVISIPDGTSGKTVEGTLSPDKNTITFTDKDVWVRRKQTPEEQARGDIGDAHRDFGKSEPLVRTAEKFDISGSPGTSRGTGWQQQRAREDWAAPSEEYLSLQKGELLSVKVELEEGWAYGESVLSSKSGFFPPTFAVKADLE